MTIRWTIAGVLCAVLALAPSSTRAGYEWRNGRWVEVTKPGQATPQAEIELIRSHLDKGKQSSALSAAESFLKRHPGHALREEALVLAGQAEFDREHYYQAYEWFEKLLAEYPNGKYADRALDREYHVGDAFLKGKKRIVGKVLRLGAETEGVEILTRIAEHAPGSAIAERALLRIGDHYFTKREYEEAAQRYDDFLQIFPKSRQAEYASLQGAKASFNMYKGPGFDDRPVLNALERFRRFNKLYPKAAARERIPAKIVTIADQLAERLYQTGEFYERTDKASAAKFYFRKVVTRYPESRWAPRAKAKLSPAAAKAKKDWWEGWLKLRKPSRPVPPAPKPKAAPLVPAVGVGSVPKTLPKPPVVPAPPVAPAPRVVPGPVPAPAARPVPAATVRPAKPARPKPIPLPKPSGETTP